MPIGPFFQIFEADLQAHFDMAKAEAGQGVASATLEFHESPSNPRNNARAEFMVIPARQLVRVTWPGIASLWAWSQGAARLSRKMFEGSHRGCDRLDILPGSVEETGLFLFELSKRFCTIDLDQRGWPPWAPHPALPANDLHDLAGNTFFFGSFAWIMRHELAHIILDHDNREANERRPWPEYEKEADDQATDWFRGSRKVDLSRGLGANPSQEELDLERRGIALGIAALWIALFETRFGRPSSVHPPVAERLVNSFDRLGLREDSLAAEVLGHAAQAWLDPQGDKWAQGPFQTALDLFYEGAVQLHRHMTNLGS